MIKAAAAASVFSWIFMSVPFSKVESEMTKREMAPIPSRFSVFYASPSEPPLKSDSSAGVFSPVEHELPPALFMQIPKAHIAAQGRMASRMGATPAATSQLQFNAAPATAIPIARKIKPRWPPRYGQAAFTSR